MRKILNKKINWIAVIFWGVVLVNIKRILTDFDTDYEYAITQAYRMVRGDHMLAQMWEPHQTSAFLNAIFIKIYLALTGTTTGIALYLNIVAVGAKSGVACVIYRTFRGYCEKTVLYFMCAFFLTVNAKKFIILDFSNMMIYFSVLLCCCLFTYFQRIRSQRTGNVFLILAAVCFCLEVLSYPSTIILFPVLLVIVHSYSLTKKKDMAVFTGICCVIGGAFLAFLILDTGWDRFLLSVKYIVTGDESHQVTKFADGLSGYKEEIGCLAVLFCICGILAFLIGKTIDRRRGSLTRFSYVRLFLAVLLTFNFVQILFDVTETGLPIVFRFLYVAVYIPILCLAFILSKYCSSEVKMAFYIGVSISIGSFLAVLILTNLPLLTAIAYLILGVMISIMPIGEYLHKKMPEGKCIRAYGILVLFLFVMIFRNIYVVQSASRTNVTVLSVRYVIKGGPMAGIFSDYMGAYVRNSDLDDWKEYVQDGDRVLMVSLPLVSTIGYLYRDTEICVDSTICTPTYNEKLLTYWELNPWKVPNVVVMECWYGEPHVSENEWIMGWIEDNFDAYVDGKYVRIYRRE